MDLEGAPVESERQRADSMHERPDPIFNRAARGDDLAPLVLKVLVAVIATESIEKLHD